MSIDMQFKKFSRSLYGAIVALDVLNCNKHDLVIAISPSTEVLLSFEDLIRYRRAVRTFVNSATK